jgi:GNAT superfamily N-acetyltransferase
MARVAARARLMLEAILAGTTHGARRRTMHAIRTLQTARGPVALIHDATPATVDALALDPGLNSLVRSPTVRRRVLLALAANPAARLTIAASGGALVGHAGIGPSFGRWAALPRARELAFEVARDWRRQGLLGRLIDAALADPAVEDEIVLAFLWPAAWDLEGTRLQPAAYRDLLMATGARGGFRVVGTDEPELGHGGALMVRIGARVPAAAVEAFERARYAGRTPALAAA